MRNMISMIAPDSERTFYAFEFRLSFVKGPICHFYGKHLSKNYLDVVSYLHTKFTTCYRSLYNFLISYMCQHFAQGKDIFVLSEKILS